MADIPVSPPTPVVPTTAPNRNTTTDPLAYSLVADAWAGSIPPYNAYLLSLGANVAFNANSAFASSSEAALSAQSALNSETAAEAAANFLGAWSALTGALAPPASVYHSGRIWNLLVSIADVSLSEPGISSDWTALNQFYLSNRTSNITLGLNDFGQIVNITSGTFTQLFTPAAELGNGWYCYIKNAGTGLITLDPDGSETIDGLTSYIMYPGEMRLLLCNGTLLTTFVIQPFQYSFITSGNFIKPPGYSAFKGLAWSAGASGSKDAGNPKGGGGGGCFPFDIQSSTLASSETMTIGAGGIASVSSDRFAGGNTSFGSIFTVYGAGTNGQGGAVGFSSALLASSTVTPFGFEGAIMASGDDTGRESIWGGASGGSDAGNACLYGGGSGAGLLGATGGASSFGGRGGDAGNTGISGQDGTAPGGGGGATNTGATSGAGARGEIRIRGVI